MTFSIVARSADEESWGVAVASKFLAVGSIVPAAIAGLGAIATQAEGNVAYKREVFPHLQKGATAVEALRRLLNTDNRRSHRQVGVVDAAGRSATHTGSECFDWAGGVAEPNVAIQGNILTGPGVVEAMKTTWDASSDEPRLDRRLLRVLGAGDEAGGDRRGRQSTSLLVVRHGAGYSGGDDIVVDLRVDDHEEPCGELGRLLDLNDLYLTASTEAEKVPVTPDLGDELEERARALGHPDFMAWVGTENLEMRVGGGGKNPEWIDEKVLVILRESH